MNRVRKQGFTLIELTVVLLILSILASISISVYTTFTQRARIARARHEINELALSVTRYETDLGVLPPSRSGSSVTGPSIFLPYTDANLGLIPGNGWMMLALLRGVVGNAAGTPTGNLTLEPQWNGPYMDIRQDQLLDFRTGARVTSSTLPADVCLADPWGRPYSYVTSADYTNADPALNATSTTVGPFTGFFNPSTFQIYSCGPNMRTRQSPNAGRDGIDDIANF